MKSYANVCVRRKNSAGRTESKKYLSNMLVKNKISIIYKNELNNLETNYIDSKKRNRYNFIKGKRVRNNLADNFQKYQDNVVKVQLRASCT